MFVFEAVLTFLLIKHYLFDFVFQSDLMVQSKGSYGRLWGLAHSLLHGLGTFVVLMIYGIKLALILAVIDLVVHYHVDWVKSRWGAKDMKKPAYWNHFGLDQLAHGLTYVFFSGVIVRSL
jgi:hypothetical protein